MIPSIASLVLYDEPTLVSTSIAAKGGAKTLKFDEKQTSTPTEDILHSILPPRCIYITQLDAIFCIVQYNN